MPFIDVLTMPFSAFRLPIDALPRRCLRADACPPLPLDARLYHFSFYARFFFSLFSLTSMPIMTFIDDFAHDVDVPFA